MPLNGWGKFPGRGGVWVGAERGEGGGDPVVQSACGGVACVPWRAWGFACVPGKGAPGATAEGHRGERAFVKELRA